ncbi:MAG: efflux RND transporter periplasmic adaptor subunit [Planctomycetota bacterium]|nr:efflux RND transporter periplasmic adaptor subunit [Planctomycetota bacterium]
MKNKSPLFWLSAVVICFGLYVAGWVHGTYFEFVWPFGDRHADQTTIGRDSHDDHAGPNHDAHGHDAHAHDDHKEPATGDFLDLSEAAKKNLGLTEAYLPPIALQSYQHTISVPAIVVDRPGRTRLPISATMTGIVTHIHAVSGEAVEPGDLILEMRLTHEDLVTAQKDYLQSLGDRDIELKEIARIEGAANSGAISNKTLLDRQYSRDKLDSLLRSQREALRLHGLTDVQIATIESDRRLLAEMKVYAPGPDEHTEEEHNSGIVHSVASRRPQTKHTLVLQDIQVQKGQSVSAGETLCILADYEELLIEGQAFENEAGMIAKAKSAGWPLSSVAGAGADVERIENLSLSWLNNEIDPATRTFKFFVTLNNEILDDLRNPSGQRHVAWKYRVGQRMQLGVPVAQWVDQIVLPIDAVVRDGVESFVFRRNGDRFNRIAVHEKHRDQSHVVIENDGAIFPGDVVALRGAHQMQMAVKSKSGAAVDPHAGHSH